MSVAVQIILGVLSLIGIGLGAYATYKGAVKSKRIEAEATPYAVLAQRVAHLETADRDKGERIRKLERRTRILSDALYEQHQWQLHGAKPPPPKIPEKALAVLLYEDEVEEDNA